MQRKWERVPVKFGYPLPRLLRLPRQSEAEVVLLPSLPVVLWDTRQVPEDDGAIQETQRYSPCAVGTRL
ncbi:unnamed protein product [Staurois parvus]|uniref:Uncharacterized protein n=1 Tax=Staurois parvus TaxID=386267 RepID=A0ABN9CQJ4_9NEOB|nr:unnamed protein product [Staurois parvus]